jgi:hypothetical protein
VDADLPDGLGTRLSVYAEDARSAGFEEELPGNAAAEDGEAGDADDRGPGLGVGQGAAVCFHLRQEPLDSEPL